MEVDKEEEIQQLEIRLITKQLQYAVSDIPYAIAANVGATELNVLLNTLLKAENADYDRNIEFDFLVAGEFLRVRLSSHLQEKAISQEETIEIEYVERFPAPEPQDCLLHDDWVSAVATRGNYILTGCYDNTLNLWTTQGKHILTIPGHSGPIKAVDWVSLDAGDDGNAVFVSSSQDATAMIWKWNIANNSVDCMRVLKGHERGVDSICADPGKKSPRLVATGSWDRMLKIWSADLDDTKGDQDAEGAAKRARSDQPITRTPVVTLQGHRECISGIQWVNEGRLITGSWDHTIKIWDLNLQGIASEITCNKSIFDISYSPLNGHVLASSADKNVRIYDTRSQQGALVKSVFLGHTQWVQCVAWSSSEEHLFMSGSYDNQTKLWDMRSPKAPLFDLVGHDDKVLSCDWSNPKYMVSGGADNSVRVFKSKKVL